MKNYIKLLLLLCFLNVGMVSQSMEEQKLDIDEKIESKELHELGLPNEIWAHILEQVYCKSNILDESKDIFQGLDAIREYVSKSCQNSSLVCRTFKELNKGQWTALKKRIRVFYKPYLNQKFLEKPLNNNQIYPKNVQWSSKFLVNWRVAGFVSDDNEIDLTNLILYDIEEKLLKLLFFYGANPNFRDISEMTPLAMAIKSYDREQHNNINIIKLLLTYGANPNIQLKGKTLLTLSILSDVSCMNKDVYITLLEHGANPNIPNVIGGKSTIKIARECDFVDFEELVKLHFKEKPNGNE